MDMKLKLSSFYRATSSCVCPSVCPSHAGIVSKRLNVGSREQRRTIVRDSSFHGHEIRTGSHPRAAPNAGEVG